MVVSQKIELEPTKKQKKILENYFNYSRYIYNKGLEIWYRSYKEWKEDPKGKKPIGKFHVQKVINHNKEQWEIDDEKYHEISHSMIIYTVMDDLNLAFKLSTRKINNKPKFKSKKSSKKSFTFQMKNKFSIVIENENKLRLMSFYKLYGLIKMKESIRFKNYSIMRVTISRKADKYFASFALNVKENPFDRPKHEKNSCVGIDLGLKTFATIADENKNIYEIKGIKKKLIKYNKEIVRLNKVLAKKRKFNKDYCNSNRYNKVRNKLERMYLRISNINNDFLHKITKELCLNVKTICIENLSVENLSKNKKLSSAIFGSLFYEFRRQLEYKSKLYNNNLIIADKKFASTQICSSCGHQFKDKNKLKLKDRVYKCPDCGMILDRDDNAALNLMKYGKSHSSKSKCLNGFRDGLHL